jgi:hypothetical protein
MSSVEHSQAVVSIQAARRTEKAAISEASRRARLIVLAETKPEHDQVVAAIRQGLDAGLSNRQIGIAYGSSDPNTIKRLVDEALGKQVIVAEAPKQSAPALAENKKWVIVRNNDGSFLLSAYSWGEQNLSGFGIFTIDDDGKNITQVDGDGWIQIQAYRLGFVEQILGELRG